ncbi:aspartate aminotransferase family protein, partial [bacterium]|nr:aspartate aminotransferase family protein [bacterium]
DRLVKEYELDYTPHVHADAVIGWAWSVFNDYDFDSNPMQFPPRTLRSLSDASIGLRTLALADSIGFDFHKTGYAPYISSLFLCKDVTDLNLISRELESMPYLFQWGNYHPGVFTLETSRSGGSVLAAWANLKFFGKEGYRALLGHIVTIAESLRKRIEESSFVTTVNDYNYGPVTLFRVYPEGVDAHQAYIAESTGTDTQEMLIKNNTYNRKIFDVLHKHMEEGDGLALSVTDCYRTAANGEPILALKSFVMTPFADEEAMDGLMKSLDKARSEV